MDASIGLVRMNKLDDSIIDTTNYTLTANREIITSKGGILGFSEPPFGDAIEEVTLSYVDLIIDDALKLIMKLSCGKPFFKSRQTLFWERYGIPCCRLEFQVRLL